MNIADMAEGTIRMALAEDLGAEGDLTSEALLSPERRGRAFVVTRQPCRVAGQPVAQRVFRLTDEAISYRVVVDDGEDASRGDVIARLEGPLLGMLAAERTALNFLCRMIGIATLTARLVALARPHGVEILDTRKTAPGLRSIDKYAVRAGGGTNHRQGLYDGVIIKDNHIEAVGGIDIAVLKARNVLGDRYPVEVEASNLAQVRKALDSGADIIMLDNMDPKMIADAVGLIDGRARVEVSGGIDAENLGSYLELGMNSISLGMLTHSAPAADLSMEFE